MSNYDTWILFLSCEIMKNKVIVFVINALKVGGAAKMIQFVANSCVGQFRSIHFISLYDTESLGFLDESIVRHNLGINAKGNRVTRRFVVVKLLRREIKSIKPDIVCSFVSDVCYYTRIATLGLNCIVTSAERGDPNIEPWWAKPIIRWAYNHSDYCFFQLENARNYFGEKVLKKSFVIPNPFIPSSDIQPYKGKHEKTIVSAGRFTWQKGYDILIKAFTKVYSKHPDYTLVLYGEGPLLSEYKSLCQQLGITEAVKFPGYATNVMEAIRKEGIFVLSSRYEGIPNSLIEAMTMKLPVVTTDCTPGGAAFLTKNGELGILVPIDDVEAIADAINNLIENEDLYATLTEKSSSVLDDLQPSKISRIWIDSFKVGSINS